MASHQEELVPTILHNKVCMEPSGNGNDHCNPQERPTRSTSIRTKD